MKFSTDDGAGLFSTSKASDVPGAKGIGIVYVRVVIREEWALDIKQTQMQTRVEGRGG